MTQTAEDFAKQALTNMGGDVEKAAELILRWAEQDSHVRLALAPMIQTHLEQLLQRLSDPAKPAA
jgi:hypothetical protein